MGYFFSLLISSMFLEEITLLSSLALIAEDKISFKAAFLACFLGINIGNIITYFIGFYVSKLNPETRFQFLKKHEAKLAQFKNSQFLTYWIVVSKLVPGARTITYFAAGFLKFPFAKFLILTFISALGVTALVLWAGTGLLELFETHWIISLAILGALLYILKIIFQKAKKEWTGS